LHPFFVLNVTPSHLKVLCHLKLQHVSANVLGLQYEEEEFLPPRYFVDVRVWTFGGCWNGVLLLLQEGYHCHGLFSTLV
jgi:hypothetical protein